MCIKYSTLKPSPFKKMGSVLLPSSAMDITWQCPHFIFLLVSSPCCHKPWHFLSWLACSRWQCSTCCKQRVVHRYLQWDHVCEWSLREGEKQLYLALDKTVVCVNHHLCLYFCLCWLSGASCCLSPSSVNSSALSASTSHCYKVPNHRIINVLEYSLCLHLKCTEYLLARADCESWKSYCVD